MSVPERMKIGRHPIVLEICWYWSPNPGLHDVLTSRWGKMMEVQKENLPGRGNPGMSKDVLVKAFICSKVTMNLIFDRSFNLFMSWSKFC